MYNFVFILYVGNSTSVTRSRAQRVAFFVGLNSNINGVQNDEDAKFENVITNVGDCYNPETGRFRVPVDGVYQFNIAVAAQGRRKVLFSQGGRMYDLNLVGTKHWSKVTSYILTNDIYIHKPTNISNTINSLVARDITP